MSSLIVFHLPLTVTKTDLKDMFSQKGNVTNVQLVLTVDGSSCYFALISYETEEEAKAALNYFDQSCVHSSRISIERCSEMKDKNETETSTGKNTLETRDKEIEYDKTINNTVTMCLPSYIKNLPYEKGQWSITNPDGKKVYLKPFLIKLGSEIVCQKKHDMLHNWPEILNTQKERKKSQNNSLEEPSLVNNMTTGSGVSLNYDFAKSSIAYLLANKQMNHKN